MKKLNELKIERSEYIEKMQEITDSEKISAEMQTEWEGLEVKVRNLDTNIKMVQTQDSLNATIIANEEPKTVNLEKRDSMFAAFKSYLQNPKKLVDEQYRSEAGGFIVPEEYLRAEPLVATTDTALIQKQVASDLIIAKSPAEETLRKLGVKIYPNLVGNFTIPSMPQLVAGYVGENLDVSTASAAPTTTTLSARPVGAFQSFTRTFLNQTNPAIYAQIIQNLQDAIWVQVAADLMDKFATEADDASTNDIQGSALANVDLIDLETNVPYAMVSPAYAMTPAIAGQLKATASIAGIAGPGVFTGKIADGEVGGYTAIGTDSVNTNNIIFADWDKICVGSWGSLEILVDPYSDSAAQNIKVTVSALFDAAIPNTKMCHWLVDASVS